MSKVLSGQILAYFSVIYPWDYVRSIMGENWVITLRPLPENHWDYSSHQAVMLVPKDRLEEIKGYYGLRKLI